MHIPQKLPARLELVLLLIIRSGTFATFSAIEKVGCMWPAGRMLCRPDVKDRNSAGHQMQLVICFERRRWD